MPDSDADHPQTSTEEVSLGENSEERQLPPSGRRAFLGSSLAITALPLLSGCGGGGSSNMGAPSIGSAPTPTPTPSPTPSPTSSSSDGGSISSSDAAAARFLLRADFCASTQEIANVRRDGADAWLTRKMAQPNDQSARQFFSENGLDEINSNFEYRFDRLTDRMIWDQLMRGGNGVRKRMAFALSQYFVVSANRLDIIWPSQAMGAYWDLLNEHAFGNFLNLLRSMVFNPAMAAFLDTIGNRKANSQTGQVPDENFAREIMQLFTIGLFELNLDGTLKTVGGSPIETYTNEDVQGLAKVFTGFDLDAGGLEISPDPQNGRPVPDAEIVRREVTPTPSRWLRPEGESQHSMQEKSFLGVTIPAGTGPIESVETALTVLFEHPNLPPFFCKQLIQRLVTSNPSPEYVRRVASVFADNGRGIRGDLASVFRAVLLDNEANSPATLDDFRSGKLREPAVRFIQFGRQFGIAANGGLGITRNLSDSAKLLGQVPLRSPSVFNFFRPSYAKPNSAAASEGKVGPEFELANETSVAGYVNFMRRNIDGRTFWLNDWLPQYAREVELAEDSDALVQHLNITMTAGQMRDFTKQTIGSAVESVPITDEASADELLRRVYIAVLLTMVSSDYLTQK